MSSAETIQSLPRNAEELAKKGRFELRRAAEALGLLATEETKGAFMSLSNPAMAEQVLAALQQYDKEKGGGGATAAKPPVRTPVTGEQPAARQPTTASNVTAGGTAVPGLAQLVEAITTLNTSIQGMDGGLTDQVQELRTILRGQNRILLTAMSLNLFLAEEVLKAPRNEVVKMAHEDVKALVAQLTELDPGIGDATSEEEDEAPEGEA